MYKGLHTENMTSTNGIHKDWETLPPLLNPDTLTENADSRPRISEEEMRKPQVCVAHMKPTKLFRYQENAVITDEEYKQMEDKLCSVVDPDILDLAAWETTMPARDLRQVEETSAYYQNIKGKQLLEKEKTAVYFKKVAEQMASKKV